MKKINSSTNPLAFTKGIAGVTFPKNSDPVSSVTSGKGGKISSPSSTGVGNLTQEKLYASSIEIKMKQFLLPAISIQAVLQPFIYNNTLRKARKKLMLVDAEVIENTAIQGLIGLLKEDEELKNLLQMYRNLLYKG